MLKQNLAYLTRKSEQVVLRAPIKDDGAAVFDLIAACPPLDQNSRYMNLVQCDHFAETCVLAERDGRALGWISGHVKPDAPDTVFVWQVAVHADARGLGLGKRMLKDLLNRSACHNTRKLETTITRDNAASWGLFQSFARDMGGELSDAPHYEREAHLAGRHATEHLVTIELPRRRMRAAA
ncbi:MAG: diaminobutyrate acetyltransferase [Rhodobacteraceae bacterium]|nr:MAG: diaminobutyrate acetyltransferase [Paracoccaceae bacterium]